MIQDGTNSAGLTQYDPCTREQITYTYTLCRIEPPVVVIDTHPQDEYTPHYAKKNKRGKFKRKGRK